MALFLQEAQQVEAPVVSLHEAMEALLDFSTAQSAMNEALLRADFIIHEQTRVLREAGDEEAAAGKEKGFMGKALDLLKKLIEKAKSMITTVYNYIKNKVQQFWAWLKKTYAGAKEFVISKYNLASAKARQAMAEARLRVGLKLVGGDGVAAEVESALKGAQAAMKEAESYANDTSWKDVGEAELEGLTKAGTQIGEDAEKAIQRAEAVVNSGHIDAKKAEAIRAGIEQLKQAMSDAAAVLNKGLKVRAKAAKAAAKADAE
jgi:ElaB/YqjD/DUF883 family membrane-anchored ribosome-binding protein